MKCTRRHSNNFPTFCTHTSGFTNCFILTHILNEKNLSVDKFVDRKYNGISFSDTDFISSYISFPQRVDLIFLLIKSVSKTKVPLIYIYLRWLLTAYVLLTYVKNINNIAISLFFQRCRQFLALGAHVPHGKRQGFAQLCGGCCDSPFCNIKGCETIGKFNTQRGCIVLNLKIFFCKQMQM